MTADEKMTTTRSKIPSIIRFIVIPTFQISKKMGIIWWGNAPPYSPLSGVDHNYAVVRKL